MSRSSEDRFEEKKGAKTTQKVLAVILLVLLAFLLIPLANQPLKAASAPKSLVSFVLAADNVTQNETGNFTQPTFSNEITLDRQYYLPATITLNYPSTTNTFLGNISTIGSGQYNYAGDDKSFTFLAKDVDVYTFSFTITYPNATLHNILIAVWEGDRSMQGETWTAIASSYTIFFKLSLTKEPSPPTADETAKAAMYQFQQLFQQLLEANKQSADAAQANSITAGIVSMMAAVTSIISLVFYLQYIRHRRRVPSEAE